MNTVTQKAGAALDCREELCRYLTENRKKLLNVILAYENDESAAEDILSIVTVEVLANPQRYLGKASVATYLACIARNQAITHVRKAVRRKAGAQVFYAHELGSGAENDNPEVETCVAVDERTPLQYAEQRQTLERVQKVLPQLQARYPAAYPTWKLHRVDGLSYAEIEQQTGTPARLAFLHVFRVSQALEKLVATTGTSGARKNNAVRIKASSSIPKVRDCVGSSA